jgi:hypothetical protein
MRLLLTALLLLSIPGCGRSSRTRCERVCTVEAQCADKLDLADHDFGACVESCQELERDSRTHNLVVEHIKCVLAATGCAEAMDCQE